MINLHTITHTNRKQLYVVDRMRSEIAYLRQKVPTPAPPISLSVCLPVRACVCMCVCLYVCVRARARVFGCGYR